MLFVEDDRWIYFQVPNGMVGWIESLDAHEFQTDDVLHIINDEVDHAPADVWRPDSWVAVVRIKLDDVTVVDAAGSSKIVPTNDVPYDVGNTVEVLPSGVVRVLSEKPIRLLDLPFSDESVDPVENFIVKDLAHLPTFEDFGGYAEVVERARDLIEAPLRYRDRLNKIGARQVRGVLFTGEPGTGKTMLAKIIARESGATFYEVSGPEIVSKWYGQSEQVLRRIFEDAATRPSAIIFFDEIDSIAAQRDEEAHEASRRLVAQLLTLMDGFDRSGNIVVIAATNRPDAIDAALRRPGRFDWEIAFPPPTQEDRESILVASARTLEKEEPLPHKEIASQTDAWSAADLTAIWTEAALLAAKDGRSLIMVEDYMNGFRRVERKVVDARRGGGPK